MSRETAAIDRIRKMDSPTITPAIAADALGCDAHAIRIMARTDPQALGFPVMRVGNRTKIPRLPFIRFLEGV